MQLSVLFLLFIFSVFFVIVSCQNDDGDVDRRDVHRIILKPEKSKKHKKRTKAPKTKPFRPNQQVTSFEDGIYEPTAHASNTRYQKQRRPQHNNHHDEYHDLIKPKPPRNEDATLYSYPEEEAQFQDTSASSNQQNYVPYLQNSGGQLNTNAHTEADVFVDWNPIPSTRLTHDYFRPRDPSSASTTTAVEQQPYNTTNKKRNKRKKKARRTTTSRPVVIFMTSSTTTTPTPILTGRPLTQLTYRDSFPPIAHAHTQVQPPTQVMNNKIKQKAPLHQQHHYVNYNHNNKSHIKYEVSGSTRLKSVVLPPPSVRYTNTQTHTLPIVAPSVFQSPYQTIHHNSDTKTALSNADNSYEVFEKAKDYKKQIKQTSFKGTLVPQPVYPQLQPFLPTVSSYTIVTKATKPTTSQLDFGKKQVAQIPILPLSHGFGKLYLGGVN